MENSNYILDNIKLSFLKNDLSRFKSFVASSSNYSKFIFTEQSCKYLYNFLHSSSKYFKYLKDSKKKDFFFLYKMNKKNFVTTNNYMEDMFPIYKKKSLSLRSKISGLYSFFFKFVYTKQNLKLDKMNLCLNKIILKGIFKMILFKHRFILSNLKKIRGRKKKHQLVNFRFNFKSYLQTFLLKLILMNKKTFYNLILGKMFLGKKLSNKYKVYFKRYKNKFFLRRDPFYISRGTLFILFFLKNGKVDIFKNLRNF